VSVIRAVAVRRPRCSHDAAISNYDGLLAQIDPSAIVPELPDHAD